MANTPIVKIDNVCMRCGFINTYTIKLTNPDTTQTYCCQNCNFIAFGSYIKWSETNVSI